MDSLTKRLADDLSNLISYVEIDYPDKQGNIPAICISAKQTLEEYRTTKECKHDWGLFSGIFLTTIKGIYPFTYICFKCQQKKVVYKEIV